MSNTSPQAYPLFPSAIEEMGSPRARILVLEINHLPSCCFQTAVGWNVQGERQSLVLTCGPHARRKTGQLRPIQNSLSSLYPINPGYIPRVQSREGAGAGPEERRLARIQGNWQRAGKAVAPTADSRHGTSAGPRAQWAAVRHSHWPQ